MGFPGKNTGMGCHFLPQGIFLGVQPLAPPKFLEGNLGPAEEQGGRMLDFFLEWAKQPTSRAVVLKNPGLMMAQVKGPTFNFLFISPAGGSYCFPNLNWGSSPKF